jgi:ferredoxin
MPSFTINQQNYLLDEDESLLAGMMRHGLQPKFSCQRGTCLSCVVKITHGEIPERAQEYIPKNARERGFALACLCYPEGQIDVELMGKKS